MASSLRAGDLLLLRVINSGKPLGKDDLARIRAALRGDSQGGHHLGLSNISTRLHLIYGGRATLDVHADERGRTVVRLEIPLKEDEA